MVFDEYKRWALMCIPYEIILTVMNILKIAYNDTSILPLEGISLTFFTVTIYYSNVSSTLSKLSLIHVDKKVIHKTVSIISTHFTTLYIG